MEYERRKRLVDNGYAIIETKHFTVFGMYSKNSKAPLWKKILHYIPIRIVRNWD